MAEPTLKTTPTDSFSEKIRNGILDIFGDKITEKLHPKETDNQIDRGEKVDSKGPTVSNCERISDFKKAGNYTRLSPVRLHEEFLSNVKSRRVTVESLFHFRSLLNTNKLNNIYYHNMTKLVASFIDSEIKKFCRQMNKKGQKGKKGKKGRILAMKLIDILLNFLGDSLEFIVEAILSANFLGSKCKRFSCLFFMEFFKRIRILDHKGNKYTYIKLILLCKLWASIEVMKHRSLYVVALAKKRFRAPSSLKLKIANGKHDRVLSFPNILTLTKSLPRCKVPIRKNIHTCLGYLKKKNVSLINFKIDNMRVEETGEASCDTVKNITIDENNLNNCDRALNDSNNYNYDLQHLDWIPDSADKESFESLYLIDDSSNNSCSNINLSAESINLLKLPIISNFVDSEQDGLISSNLLKNLQNVNKTQDSLHNSENNVDHIELQMQCDNAFSTSRNIDSSVQKNTQSLECYTIIEPDTSETAQNQFQTTVEIQNLNEISQDKESTTSLGSKIKYISLNKYKKQTNYIEKIIKYVKVLKENEVLSLFDSTICFIRQDFHNYNNQENTNNTPLSLSKKEEKSRHSRQNKRSLYKQNVPDLSQQFGLIINPPLPVQFYVPIIEVNPPINQTIKHEHIKNIARCLMLEPQHTITIPNQTLSALKQNYINGWNHVLTIWHCQVLNQNQQYFLNSLKMSYNPNQRTEIDVHIVQRCMCFSCNNHYNILVKHYEYCLFKLYDLINISEKNSSQSEKKQNLTKHNWILDNSTHQLIQQYTLNGNNINPVPQSVINFNEIINNPCLICKNGICHYQPNSETKQFHFSYYIEAYNELNHLFQKNFYYQQIEEHRLNLTQLFNNLYIPQKNELYEMLANNLINPQNELHYMAGNYFSVPSNFIKAQDEKRLMAGIEHVSYFLQNNLFYVLSPNSFFNHLFVPLELKIFPTINYFYPLYYNPKYFDDTWTYKSPDWASIQDFLYSYYLHLNSK